MNAIIILFFSTISRFVFGHNSADYSEHNLYYIAADDTCTACYEIDGLSFGMGSPWLTETGLEIKKESLAKRGPVGVLHPGLDLKQVLKKEPKEAPIKPEPSSPGSPGKVEFNSTEVSERKILIVKKKPNKPEPESKTAPNVTMMYSLDLEYFLVKPKPGGRDIFSTPDPKRAVLVKKIEGPSHPSKKAPGCNKIGPGGDDCEGTPSISNITLSGYGTYYENTVSSVGLYGAENTWWRSDGTGTFFELSDVYNGNVFYSGTLCPESDTGDACGMALEEGFYVFHVYSAEDPNKDAIAWNFCGTHGGAETDLLFHISSSGECSPMSMSTSSQSVSEARSYFVLKGTLELSGYFTENLNWEDKKILMSSMLYESRQLMTSASSASFQDWLRSVVVYNMHETARNGDEVTNEVSFYLAMVSEDFGVNGVDEDKKSFLLEVMTAALESSMETNNFVYNIHNVDQFSSKSVTNNLAGVYSAKLVSLSALSSDNKESTAYALKIFNGFFAHMSDSMGAEADGYSKVLSSMSVPAVVIGVVAAAAFLAGIAWFVIISNHSTRYAKVEQESTHASSSI